MNGRSSTEAIQQNLQKHKTHLPVLLAVGVSFKNFD
jgi:hypothetical protein